MEIWKAILVGIVQGFSEFLPISSSGHIALTQFLLGMREPGVLPEEDITFELVVHIGTFLSVVIYFRERLFGLLFSLWQKERTEEREMILWLFIATIPAQGDGIWSQACHLDGSGPGLGDPAGSFPEWLDHHGGSPLRDKTLQGRRVFLPHVSAGYRRGHPCEGQEYP